MSRPDTTKMKKYIVTYDPSVTVYAKEDAKSKMIDGVKFIEILRGDMKHPAYMREDCLIPVKMS